MTQEKMMMVYLPTGEETITNKILGHRIKLLPNQIGSCPIAVGRKLMERYPVIHEVVDAPLTKAPLPPSIAIESLTTKIIKWLRNTA